ncbi:MAG: serine hydrolase domain-containing protein [Dermatophilaceae bacterium]
MAVVRDGAVEIDHCAGTRDGVAPWTSQTLVMTFSVAKPFAAWAFLDAVAEGHLGLEQPVTSLWPEYGQSGKEATTMRHLLSHQAGLPDFPEHALGVDYDDRDTLVDLLAQAVPIHPPGAGVAEHALTYGHLLDEVLRRATGEALAERFARIAAAAGWDLHLRVEDRDLPRVANPGRTHRTMAQRLSRGPTLGPGAGPAVRAARAGGAELRALPQDTIPRRGPTRQRPGPGALLRRRHQTRRLRRRPAGPRPVARIHRTRGDRSRSGAQPARHLDPRLPDQPGERTGRAREDVSRKVTAKLSSVAAVRRSWAFRRLRPCSHDGSRSLLRRQPKPCRCHPHASPALTFNAIAESPHRQR